MGQIGRRSFGNILNDLVRGLADRGTAWYNRPMTYQRYFEKQLGKAAVKRLPAGWKRHIKRIDGLPKPVKSITIQRIREIVGA